jgi:transcriptional regulator with XRE-family HTH domain
VSHYSDRLRRDREAAGLRLARVAGRLGITVPQYREPEDGERWPSYEEYNALSKLYAWPRAIVGPDGRVTYE